MFSFVSSRKWGIFSDPEFQEFHEFEWSNTGNASIFAVRLRFLVFVRFFVSIIEKSRFSVFDRKPMDNGRTRISLPPARHFRETEPNLRIRTSKLPTRLARMECHHQHVDQAPIVLFEESGQIRMNPKSMGSGPICGSADRAARSADLPSKDCPFTDVSA